MPRVDISAKELNGKYTNVNDLSLELNCEKDKIFSILHYINANVYYAGKTRFVSNNDISTIKSYSKMYSVKEASIICFGTVDYNRLKRARISMGIGRDISFFTEDELSKLKQYANMTPSEKIKYIYDNKTDEEKQNLIDKIKNYFDNETQEQKEVRELHRQQGCLKKYGVDNPSKNKNIADKINNSKNKKI